MTSNSNPRDDGFVISGEENVRMARLLALRSALKLEIQTTMRLSSRKSARKIAQEFLGLPGRPPSKTVYSVLNKYIVNQLGPKFDKPLDNLKL